MSYFLNDGECTLCPMGTTCAENGASTMAALDLDPGYWRIGNYTDVVHPCPIAQGCKGGTAFVGADGVPGDGYCAVGYTGVLCAAVGSCFFNTL